MAIGQRSGSASSARSRGFSWLGRVEQIHRALDIELFEATESRTADQFFGPRWPETGAQTGASLRQRLGHAVKQAETVEHRRHGIAVVLEPVRGPRLDDEQRSLGIEQGAQLLQGCF